jgi:hypothetical protein
MNEKIQRSAISVNVTVTMDDLFCYPERYQRPLRNWEDQVS